MNHLPSKAIAYWICQLLGWGGYTFLLVVSTAGYYGESQVSKVVSLQCIIGGTGLLTSHVLRHVVRKGRWLDLVFKKLVPRLVAACALGAVVSMTIIHSLMIGVLDWQNTVEPIVWTNVPIYTVNMFFMLAVWSLLYVGYTSLENARRAKMESLRAQAAQKEAELMVLKAQVNPHFLFNALNNIRALILDDPRKARTMVTHLSDMLRYSVDFNQQDRVTLEEEFEVVDSYLQLTSVQYDRLSYCLEIDETCKRYRIPPMVIQTLVENAIKHGISQLPGPGHLALVACQSEETVIITVANTGRLRGSETGTGSGIKNAMERMSILFEKLPKFSLTQHGDQVVARLTLPIKL